MAGSFNSKGSGDAAFYFRLLRWIVCIILAVLLIPWLVNVIRRKLDNNDSEAMKVEIKRRKRLRDDDAWCIDMCNQLGLSSQWLDATRSIAHHLGTKYDWYDPRHWTENEDEIDNILRQTWDTGNALYGERRLPAFLTIECIYHHIVCPGESLYADMQRLLPSDQFNAITWTPEENFSVPKMEY